MLYCLRVELDATINFFLKIYVKNLCFKYNCLVFQFEKTNYDQTGKNAYQLLHVYETPNKPTTLPILAPDVYIYLNPGVML